MYNKIDNPTNPIETTSRRFRPRKHSWIQDTSILHEALMLIGVDRKKIIIFYNTII
jgi:hypothetical protein